jgi:undecaprenyl-diphosphatase
MAMVAGDLTFALAAGITLGVVQGVSEWLPVSSKTQIIVVSTILFGLTFNQGYSLGLFLEFGTFFAAVVYFWKELVLVLKAIVGKGGPVGRLLLKYLLIVTVITGVMGVAIYKGVESLTFGSSIGVPMIILGAVLIIDGLFIRYSRSRAIPHKSLQDMKLKDLLLIGFAQGLSAFPGVSRSGTTVSMMLILGTDPKESFRLSFLALIPASIGATLVTLLFSSTPLVTGNGVLSLPVIAVALIVTFLVGSLMIRWLLRVAAHEKITTLVFILGTLAILSGILGIIFGGSITLS